MTCCCTYLLADVDFKCVEKDNIEDVGPMYSIDSSNVSKVVVVVVVVVVIYLLKKV